MNDVWNRINKQIDNFRKTNPEDILTIELKYSEGVDWYQGTEFTHSLFNNIRSLVAGDLKKMFFYGAYIKVKKPKEVEQPLKEEV